jgi:uncharacterized membrane protein
MGRGRLEAFSDAVFAVIITIMVLDIKVPHGDTFDDLLPLLPIFLSYVLSFVFIGIYWNNHHHLLHLCDTVTGAMLWANLHLLFWLSLLPFATGWMGENHFSTLPIVLYGAVLFLAGIAYNVLQLTIIRSQGSDSILRHAMECTVNFTRLTTVCIRSCSSRFFPKLTLRWLSSRHSLLASGRDG